MKAWMKDGCPEYISPIEDENHEVYAYLNIEKNHYVAAREYWLSDNRASAHQALLDLGWKHQRRVKIYFDEINNFRVIPPDEAQELLWDKDNRNRRGKKLELMVHFRKHRVKSNILIKNQKMTRLEDFEGGG